MGNDALIQRDKPERHNKNALGRLNCRGRFCENEILAFRKLEILFEQPMLITVPIDESVSP